MQGAQTQSRYRGIGRYTLAFVKAVIRNAMSHEVVLVFNGQLKDSIAPLRLEFAAMLPEERMLTWYAPSPLCTMIAENETRFEVAKIIREAFIKSLNPDVVHITSLFEGFADDAVMSIGEFDTSSLVSVTLYDLIPLIYSDVYLKANPRHEAYYLRQVDYLKSADLHLAISEFSRQEATKLLDLDPHRTLNKSSAVNTDFCSTSIDVSTFKAVLTKFGINKRFFLYTGGADTRKNLPRLVDAFVALKANELAQLQLVFAGRMTDEFLSYVRSLGAKSRHIIFTDYVTDAELICLYTQAECFVFPSWHEGFGLPALEAMSCGTAVIGADAASLPEVIGLEEALFDPFSIDSIRDALRKVAFDTDFRIRLEEHSRQRALHFSWDATAKIALGGWEQLVSAKHSDDQATAILKSEDPMPVDGGINDIAEVVSALRLRGLLSANQEELLAIAKCLDLNHPPKRAYPLPVFEAAACVN